MKTDLVDSFKNSSDGKIAEDILRACVHCGFCNATCPTYQIIGDENDGPRGRIYLIKQMLEGKPVSDSTQLHLDRCLTCRNCETTCPSGVQYSTLLDIGRKEIEARSPRSLKEKATRKLLRSVLPYRNRFGPLLNIGRVFKPILPAKIKSKMPRRVAKGSIPIAEHKRRMLVLDGCVQPALSPDINATTARVLHKLGISLITQKKAGCCGAVSQHLSAEAEALLFMKNNIDAWWPEIESGAEAIVMTASGCGAMVKDYAHHLRDDAEYAEKAQRVSALCKDISEIIADEDLSALSISSAKSSTKKNTEKGAEKISWHPPCTLQHGQKVNGVVEKILTDCGYELLAVNDQHLCCGSAGTYSILQPVISQQLQANKINNLQANKPDMIVTGNIGCQTHLQEVSDVPVIHWIHLLDK
ncbi:MAG: glycolate oxidase subunit GlcF [Cocleimonas sp.]